MSIVDHVFCPITKRRSKSSWYETRKSCSLTLSPIQNDLIGCHRITLHDVVSSLCFELGQFSLGYSWPTSLSESRITFLLASATSKRFSLSRPQSKKNVFLSHLPHEKIMSLPCRPLLNASTTTRVGYTLTRPPILKLLVRHSLLFFKFWTVGGSIFTFLEVLFSRCLQTSKFVRTFCTPCV